MLYRILPLLLLGACGTGKDEPVDTAGATTPETDLTDSEPETDTGVAPDPTTDTGTPPEALPYACYARVAADYLVDGVIDTRSIWAYDDALLATDLYPIHHEWDGDGGYTSMPDGAPEEVQEWTWDASAQLLEDRFDDDGDGGWDETRQYVWDAYGNMLQSLVDYGADGTIDETWTYTHDADGNVVHVEADFDGDGLADYWTDAVYDASGQVLLSETDLDGDGAVDDTYTYTYDAEGRLIELVGTDANGDTFYRQTVTYDDPTGDSGLYLVDVDGDGGYDASYYLQYGADGLVSHYEVDADYDGTVDETWDYTWDANGNMLMFVLSYDDPTYGSLQIVGAYTYDAQGRMLGYGYDVILEDYGGYVFPYYDEAWTWSCP